MGQSIALEAAGPVGVARYCLYDGFTFVRVMTAET